MRRRRLIATSALLTASLAGCVGDDDEEVEQPDGEEGDDENGQEEPSEEEEPEDGEEEDQDGEAEIQIVEDELVIEEDDISTDAYVAATVENVGDGDAGQITLNVDWYDEDGNYLDDGREDLYTLGSGETWEARAYSLGSAEDVADYELEGEFETERPSAADGLNLVESEMNVGENEVVVEGNVENQTGEEQSYVESIVLVYDGEETILGSVRTNVSDLQEGDTWAFDVTWRGRDRVDAAEDFRVVLSDSVL